MATEISYTRNVAGFPIWFNFALKQKSVHVFSFDRIT